MTDRLCRACGIEMMFLAFTHLGPADVCANVNCERRGDLFPLCKDPDPDPDIDGGPFPPQQETVEEAHEN